MTRDEAEAPPRKEPRGRVFRDEAYQVRAVGEQGRIRHPLDKLWLVWRAITKAASLAHSIMPAYESFKQSAVYAKYVGNEAEKQRRLRRTHMQVMDIAATHSRPRAALMLNDAQP